MNNEHKEAVVDALKTYLPVAAKVKDDEHIRLLEEVVVELEEELPAKPSEKDLFDDGN